MITIRNFLMLSFIGLILFPTSAFCQIKHIDTLKNRVIQQLTVFPQEKIYVQTDKPYYIGGEDIWFRIHIVDAFLHQPFALSRYVYGELISPVDTLISRVKIRPDSLGYFHGNFQLKEGLAEGDYQLRFYTRYMENISEDYFFRKKIRIGDPLSALFSTEATFTRNEKNQQLEVNLKFSDNSTGQLIWPEKIKINYDLQNLEIKPDKDSIVRFAMKKNRNSKYLHVEFDYEKRFHRQFILVTSEVHDFDVTFHPEGGQLVMDTPCRVAFKALNSNGYGENITGIIFNESGDTLSHFNSQHNGMGVFLIHSNGEKYFVECQNLDGIKKRYELPVPESNSLALQTYWVKDDLWVKVIKPAGFQPLDSIYLLMQSRGEPKYLIPIDFNNEPIQIPRQNLPSGIIQVTLSDKNFMPFSERLVFNYKEQDIASSFFTTSRNSYKSRELVKTKIRLTDNDNNPVIGDFSLSVTDDKVVIPDTTMSICHYLLLSSDIKGYIENPSYYFQQGREQQANLDVLLMTQGWRRYDYMKVLRGEPEIPSIAEEKSFVITGSVKGGLMLNRSTDGHPVNAISLDPMFFESTVTDENGRFKIENFELPDSTRLVIQALTKRGGNYVELFLDEESFPGINSLPEYMVKNKFELFEQYAEKADQFYVTENGMRMIYLQEVEVRAMRIERKIPIRAIMHGRVVNSEEFSQYSPRTVYDIIRNTPGVLVSGEYISIRGSEFPPLVLLDNMEIMPEDLSTLNVHDIDAVAVMGGTIPLYGMRGANGIIFITTKTGEMNYIFRLDNIKNFNPLGYQVTKEFYSHKYETEEQKNNLKPDLRTTIHWTPYVVTDEYGEAEVSFYSADAHTTYSVVYEGVTYDGLPVHGIGKVEIGL